MNYVWFWDGRSGQCKSGNLFQIWVWIEARGFKDIHGCSLWLGNNQLCRLQVEGLTHSRGLSHSRCNQRLPSPATRVESGFCSLQVRPWPLSSPFLHFSTFSSGRGFRGAARAFVVRARIPCCRWCPAWRAAGTGAQPGCSLGCQPWLGGLQGHTKHLSCQKISYAFIWESVVHKAL